MAKQYVMAFDASTTSTQAIIFDRKGEVVSMASEEFTQFYPKPG